MIKASPKQARDIVRDEELMLRIKEGDMSCFYELVKRYKGPVINFAYRMLQDKHIAEDIAQETFFTLYQNVKSYRAEAKFSTWLFTLANSRCVDQLRKMERYQKVQVSSIEKEKEISIDSFHKEAVKEEVRQKVQEAVAGLPQNYRQVIILKEFHNFSTSEIAGILGYPVNTIKSWVQRARMELKEKLMPLVKDEIVT